MESAEKFRVEVAYARPDAQFVVPLKVLPQTRLEDAIRRSGILEKCPEIDLAKYKVGIFGRISALDRVLRPGDRVEIYRSLIADPKQVRKKRAQQQKPGGKSD
jgi:putative ubiquitin-RnfH superfamily antitoxin RatB of RatAB toxin-antitoxin module